MRRVWRCLAPCGPGSSSAASPLWHIGQTWPPALAGQADTGGGGGGCWHINAALNVEFRPWHDGLLVALSPLRQPPFPPPPLPAPAAAGAPRLRRRWDGGGALSSECRRPGSGWGRIAWGSRRNDLAARPSLRAQGRRMYEHQTWHGNESVDGEKAKGEKNLLLVCEDGMEG